MTCRINERSRKEGRESEKLLELRPLLGSDVAEEGLPKRYCGSDSRSRVHRMHTLYESYESLDSFTTFTLFAMCQGMSVFQERSDRVKPKSNQVKVDQSATPVGRMGTNHIICNVIFSGPRKSDISNTYLIRMLSYGQFGSRRAAVGNQSGGLDYEDEPEDEEDSAPGKWFDLGRCQL